MTSIYSEEIWTSLYREDIRTSIYRKDTILATHCLTSVGTGVSKVLCPSLGTLNYHTMVDI